MDVGVVGIGDIATKAYLPLLATWPGLRLHLASRDEGRRRAAAERFHAASVAPDLESLLERDLDAVLVTAATAAHPELVARALRVGVPVHVDKPLADSGSAAEELVALARRTGTPLAVGFNRRFAPSYRQVAEPRPRLAVLGKHRPDLADDVRRVVFDDLVHVVDTLRWLLPGAAALGDVSGRVVAGRLEHVVFALTGDGVHGLGLMNRVSGTSREVLEAHRPQGTRIVHDLARTEAHGTPGVTLTRAGGWTPTLTVRGFPAMVADFLDAVAEREAPSQTLDDVLATHQTCETLVSRLAQLDTG